MRHAILAGVMLVALMEGSAAQTMPGIATLTPATFGMVGLALGQTARLNVLNIVRTPPPVMIPQLPCRVHLSFFDSDGKLLKEATIENLGFGQAGFLDLPMPGFTGASVASRMQVSAAVGLPGVGSTLRPSQYLFCSILPSLEVFDSATGRTTVMIAAPAITPVVVPAARLNPEAR